MRAFLINDGVKANKHVFFLQFLAVFLPASFIYYFALNAGLLPDNDYWSSVYEFHTQDGGFSTNIHDWIKRNNEHLIFIPKLVYALNIVLTDGNNIGLSLFSWWVSFLLLGRLYAQIPETLNKMPFLFVCLLLICSVYVFNPLQAHNWLLGMSGVAWLTANYFSVSAILLLLKYHSQPDKLYFIQALLFSLLALVTYSTSLSVFPTLLIAAFFLKLKGFDKSLLFALFIGVFSWYLLSYETPPGSPKIQRSADNLFGYFFAFLGGVFVTEISIAIVIGLLGVMSSLYIVFLLSRENHRRNEALPWFFIQIYCMGNAAMAAIARSGFGLEQVFSSRYASLPCLFWLSWIMILYILARSKAEKNNKTVMKLWVVFVVFGMFSSYYQGQQTIFNLYARAQNKSLTAASLYSGAYDLELIDQTLIAKGSYAMANKIALGLKNTKMVPFNDNGLFKDCPEIGYQISNIVQPDRQHFGNIDQIRHRGYHVMEVRGWAYSANKQARCIVLTNAQNRVKGVATYGIERMDIPNVHTWIKDEETGWQGYGRFKYDDLEIKAFALVSNGQWVPLRGYYKINRQQPHLEKVD